MLSSHNHIEKNFRFQNIDTGIDGVRKNFASAGLLNKPLHLIVVVDDHDTVVERILYSFENNRRFRFLVFVKLDRVCEIDIGKAVARDHDKGLMQLILHGFDAASGAQGTSFFDCVFYFDAKLRSVAKVIANRIRKIEQCEYDVVHTVSFEKIDDVLGHRLVCDRNHRFRQAAGQRA